MDWICNHYIKSSRPSYNAVDSGCLEPESSNLSIVINILSNDHLSLSTISYGSILMMYCVGINFNYCMSVPLNVLVPLAADFDGKRTN